MTVGDTYVRIGALAENSHYDFRASLAYAGGSIRWLFQREDGETIKWKKERLQMGGGLDEVMDTGTEQVAPDADTEAECRRLIQEWNPQASEYEGD